MRNFTYLAPDFPVAGNVRISGLSKRYALKIKTVKAQLRYGKNRCTGQSERRRRENDDSHQPGGKHGRTRQKDLLVDADPQANATSGLGLDINGRSIYDCITGEAQTEDVIQAFADIKKLDILPSSINLVGAETELLEIEDGQKRMRNLLAPLRQRYDFILIDCSPSLGLVTLNALVAADSVLIPVQCEYFALEGLGKLLNTIRMTQSKLNPQLQIEGFLLTMYDARLRLANQVAGEVREHFGDLAFQTIIQRNTRLSEAPSFGKPALLYDASSSGSVNYLNLAKEFIKKNRKK